MYFADIEEIIFPDRDPKCSKLESKVMEARNRLISDWMTGDDILEVVQLGDLLEFKRVIGQTKRRIYSHWAVFVGLEEGEHRVIHLSTPDGDKYSIDDTVPLYARFGSVKKGAHAEVRSDLLVSVANGDLVRVNNSMDNCHRPFPPVIIVDRAKHRLGDKGYSLLFENCEHFAIECRNGIKRSDQAFNAKALALTSLLAVTGNPTVALAVSALFYIGSTHVARWSNRTFGTNFSMF